MRKQDSLNEAGLSELAEAIRSTKNAEELCAFLIDLCSVRELNSMIQRLRVAQMIRDGRTYADIVKATGASTAIVSRVSRVMAAADGKGGLETAIERVEKQE